MNYTEKDFVDESVILDIKKEDLYTILSNTIDENFFSVELSAPIHKPEWPAQAEHGFEKVTLRRRGTTGHIILDKFIDRIADVDIIYKMEGKLKDGCFFIDCVIDVDIIHEKAIEEFYA